MTFDELGRKEYDMVYGDFHHGAEVLCSNSTDEFNVGLERLLFRLVSIGCASEDDVCRALRRWVALIKGGYFCPVEDGETLPATEEGRAFSDKLKYLRETCVRAGVTFECRN